MLNKFFSNAVKNLTIPNFRDNEPLADNISHSPKKSIMKCRSHPRISVIKDKVSEKTFKFSRVLKRIKENCGTIYH